MGVMYDVIIVGGGPAGSAAAVYSARKKMKTLIISESFGGQSVVSDDIQNWIGEAHISGIDLAEKLENHVKAYEGEIDIKEGEKVKKVKKIKCDEGRSCDFEVETDGGAYQGKAIILASGGRRRRLGVPGEENFEGKGVVYCSTCDAPLFGGRTVAVVGGGNAGVEAVIDLLPYAEKIYLLERNGSLRADKSTQEKIRDEEKVEVIFHADTKKITGEKGVEGLVYENEKGEEKELEVGGVFVEIGSVPNSEIVEGLVELDGHGQVKIDSKHATTSQEGIFAAGDVTDDPYKQNNISAGDGVKAALSAYGYVQKIKRTSPHEDEGE